LLCASADTEHLCQKLLDPIKLIQRRAMQELQV